MVTSPVILPNTAVPAKIPIEVGPVVVMGPLWVIVVPLAVVRTPFSFGPVVVTDPVAVMVSVSPVLNVAPSFVVVAASLIT